MSITSFCGIADAMRACSMPPKAEPLLSATELCIMPTDLGFAKFLGFDSKPYSDCVAKEVRAGHKISQSFFECPSGGIEISQECGAIRDQIETLGKTLALIANLIADTGERLETRRAPGSFKKLKEIHSALAQNVEAVEYWDLIFKSHALKFAERPRTTSGLARVDLYTDEVTKTLFPSFQEVRTGLPFIHQTVAYLKQELIRPDLASLKASLRADLDLFAQTADSLDRLVRGVESASRIRLLSTAEKCKLLIREASEIKSSL